MRFYEFLMTIIAVAIILLGFTFGLDRELARRDYAKAVEKQPITGCIFRYNCDFYTKLLGENNV